VLVVLPTPAVVVLRGLVVAFIQLSQLVVDVVPMVLLMTAKPEAQVAAQVLV
jgi:hypothetical protein